MLLADDRTEVDDEEYFQTLGEQHATNVFVVRNIFISLLIILLMFWVYIHVSSYIQHEINFPQMTTPCLFLYRGGKGDSGKKCRKSLFIEFKSSLNPNARPFSSIFPVLIININVL